MGEALARMLEVRRTHAHLPARVPFIVPDRGPFVLSLCQYGSLHVDLYKGTAVSEILDAARAAGLAQWDGHCGDIGLDDGAIEGRALWLDASPDGDGED